MTQTPKTFIFIGRSGCGKGTQADLLIDYLKKNDPAREVVYLEIGKLFRDFWKGEGYTQELSKNIYAEGGLQPEFLAISTWSQFLINHMKSNVHVVIDGVPRSLTQALALDSVAKFYSWDCPNILLLNISREMAKSRLLARKRADDSEKGIDARLDWFDTDVAKAITFYEDSQNYAFHDINGDQSVEAIHQEILQKTGLLG